MNTFLKNIFGPALLSLSLVTAAQVRLPALLRDSMVIQRETPVRIWGWAAADEPVTVTFNHHVYRTKASSGGQWQVMLAPAKAGGPYTLAIDGRNHLILSNILVGDVWVCAGQSNMVHQLALHRERYAAEIAAAADPDIRQWYIPTLTNLQGPRDDLPTSYWKPAVGNDVLDFSAVAYFFAKQIHDRYHIPIGIINASVGGTPIEAWTSREGLAPFGLDSIIRRNADTAYVNGIARAGRQIALPLSDEGLRSTPQWYDTAFTPSDWRPFTVPGYWEDQGVRNLDGVVWFSKSFFLRPDQAGAPAQLVLGRIVDADQTYINGRLVASTSYQYPQRRYPVPAQLLKAGRNTVVIRISNYGGKGGFVPGKPYELRMAADTLDLRGPWLYRVGEAFRPQPSLPSFQAQNAPSALYNAMVAPIAPFTIKGVLWYQGEANTGNAIQYGSLLPALIGDWRRQFGQPQLPFLYVQLPNFGDADYLPVESSRAQLREAQRKTLSVPNTAMAVTIDLGEWNDIHPDRKKEVGDRLALAARKLVYGEKELVASGPTLRSAVLDGDRILLTFGDTGGGLVTGDGRAPGGFALAGSDRKFVNARARIEGDKVVVWSESVPRPVYVRYAWADNPPEANLFNREGLPASPFRTE